MAQYFVGDIQGCFNELALLLQQVNFSPENDELWAVGDLVARGPDSLKTLRFIKNLGQSAKVVLGNHDLHLLATYYGLKKAKPRDNLSQVLTAPDIDDLMHWLRQQPLIQKISENAYMSHAGFYPKWHIQQAIECAEFVSTKLKSNKVEKWLACMYGEQPARWQDVKTKQDKFRFTVNAFTRMRYCLKKDASLEFDCKQHPSQAPKNIQPWFDFHSSNQEISWVFGHWAALMGECNHPHFYALDTGCVWGNHLTLLRWQDKKQFTQDALV